MNKKMLRRIGEKRRRLKARVYKLFRPKLRTIRNVTCHGAEFVALINEDVGWRIIRDKKYEEHEIHYVEKSIRPGDLCLDIGANIGIYSVFMAKAAQNVQVIAFEPSALINKLLALNLELNGLGNVTVHDYLVSDQEGNIEYSVSEDSAYSSILSTGRSAEMESVTKKSVTIDGILKNCEKKIGVIKIDVEGAELLVLKGAIKTLSNRSLRPRALLVEMNAENAKAYGYAPNDIIEFMNSCDYQAHSITYNGLVPGWPQVDCSENVLFLPSPDN